ncbi:hypothetical protein AAG906_041205 [Vitis piasezkii]|uniref:Uncharacterized protein n=1 Tax=Vitis vinifera TaxID=29760 RepID=A0A438CMI4_VITVI|nr:hypothetical protein CK203_093235 [Vitis vinifera]
MGKRPQILVLWLFLVLIFLVEYSHGSRHTQVLKEKPKPQNSPRSFFGFLPKGMPIPPSGPSKKHNDIGLQSSQQSP